MAFTTIPLGSKCVPVVDCLKQPLPWQEFHVHCETIDEMLASLPTKEVYDSFLSQRRDRNNEPIVPEEVRPGESEALPSGLDEKGEPYKPIMTMFPRDEQGRPFLWAYQLRGFCKEAAAMLIRAGEVKASANADAGEDAPKPKKKKGATGKETTLSAKFAYQYKTKINGLVFFNPNKILLNIPEGKEISVCTRPLIAETMQGKRVTLASSETVPAGTTFDFSVRYLRNDLDAHTTFKDLILEWLAYGEYHGLLQWRNAGKGCFKASVYENE